MIRQGVTVRPNQNFRCDDVRSNETKSKNIISIIIYETCVYADDASDILIVTSFV